MSHFYLSGAALALLQFAKYSLDFKESEFPQDFDGADKVRVTASSSFDSEVDTLAESANCDKWPLTVGSPRVVECSRLQSSDAQELGDMTQIDFRKGLVLSETNRGDTIEHAPQSRVRRLLLPAPIQLPSSLELINLAEDSTNEFDEQVELQRGPRPLPNSVSMAFFNWARHYDALDDTVVLLSASKPHRLPKSVKRGFRHRKADITKPKKFTDYCPLDQSECGDILELNEKQVWSQEACLNLLSEARKSLLCRIDHRISLHQGNLQCQRKQKPDYKLKISKLQRRRKFITCNSCLHD